LDELCPRICISSKEKAKEEDVESSIEGGRCEAKSNIRLLPVPSTGVLPNMHLSTNQALMNFNAIANSVLDPDAL
jgi:hypothetical protein